MKKHDLLNKLADEAVCLIQARDESVMAHRREKVLKDIPHIHHYDGKNGKQQNILEVTAFIGGHKLMLAGVERFDCDYAPSITSEDKLGCDALTQLYDQSVVVQLSYLLKVVAKNKPFNVHAHYVGYSTKPWETEFVFP